MHTLTFRKVILYGSYARGDFNEESEIDILLMIVGEENLNINNESI